MPDPPPLAANLGAVDYAYFVQSGARLNVTNDYNFPLFTYATMYNTIKSGGAANSSYPAIIAPYTKNSDGTFTLDNSGLTQISPITNAAWATITSGNAAAASVDSPTELYSYSVTKPVYFAANFYSSSGTPVPPTTGTQDKSNWTIYLSMESTGPYEMVFSAAEVRPNVVAQIGTLASGMAAAGWNLFAATDGSNNITLTYSGTTSGTTTQFVPCLTLKRNDNADSIAYLCVQSCTGFGIQVISTFSFPQTQPSFTTPSQGGGGSQALTCGPSSGCQPGAVAGLSTLSIGFMTGTVLLLIAVIVLSVELAKRRKATGK